MGFFSKPEIRQFNYTPRYWDPRKEEMEQRRARIRKQLQEERERAMQEDSVDFDDDTEFKPRTSDSSKEEDPTPHRTTLQHGFLREQRGRSGVSDENKFTKVVLISAAVLVVYLILKFFGI